MYNGKYLQDLTKEEARAYVRGETGAWMSGMKKIVRDENSYYKSRLYDNPAIAPSIEQVSANISAHTLPADTVDADWAEDLD